MRNAAAPSALLLLCLLAAAPAARAQGQQQPFFTETADVTEAGQYYFEAINEFDVLRADARPALRQNSASLTVSYGLFRGAEVSVTLPVVTIFNERGASPRRATGLGDVGYAFKYNFLREREGSRRPALAVSFFAEAPTGSAVKGTGYGAANYTFNGIAQKSLTGRTVLRLNAGLAFAAEAGEGGGELRGRVLVGGVSVVRRFNARLALGAELRGARAQKPESGRGLLLGQFGGNYALGERVTFDFGILGGRLPAAPRLGAQFGLSIDLDTRLSERR